MKDILNYRVEENPDKIFIQHNNKEISYKIFNFMVNNAMNTIKSMNYQEQYIGIQINDTLKNLILIIAMNRCKKIPVLYPNYPNIKDYLSSTNIPVLLKDQHINIDSKINNGTNKTIYDAYKTQLVLFTSGSTGKPKACKLTYNNFYQSAKQWNKIIQFSKKDIYLNHMPITHVSGLCIFFRALYYNFKMLICNFNANHYVQNIKKEQVTLISMVPTMLQRIIDNNTILEPLQNLKSIIIGGARINKNLFKTINTNKIPTYMSYGMTETCSGIAGFWIEQKNNIKYKAHNNVNITVDKSQIIIKSKSIMKSYLHHKNTNGIFKSNDIGIIENNGIFKIQKTSDNIINSGGEKASISYVKKHIESYPEIKKCTLKIIRNNKWGEVLHAYVSYNKNIEASFWVNKMKKCLPKHMIPKKIITQ